MANYLLDQTGAEVQAILDAVQNPDTTPAAGSSNLITSGGVQAAIAGSAATIEAEVSELGHKVRPKTPTEYYPYAATWSGVQNYAPFIVELYVDGTKYTSSDIRLRCFRNRQTGQYWTGERMEFVVNDGTNGDVLNYLSYDTPPLIQFLHNADYTICAIVNWGAMPVGGYGANYASSANKKLSADVKDLSNSPIIALNLSDLRVGKLEDLLIEHRTPTWALYGINDDGSLNTNTNQAHTYISDVIPGSRFVFDKYIFRANLYYKGGFIKQDPDFMPASGTTKIYDSPTNLVYDAVMFSRVGNYQDAVDVDICSRPLKTEPFLLSQVEKRQLKVYGNLSVVDFSQYLVNAAINTDGTLNNATRSKSLVDFPLPNDKNVFIINRVDTASYHNIVFWDSDHNKTRAISVQDMSNYRLVYTASEVAASITLISGAAPSGAAEKTYDIIIGETTDDAAKIEEINGIPLASTLTPSGIVTNIKAAGTSLPNNSGVVDIPNASALQSGLLTPADKAKLDIVVPGDINISGSGVTKNAAAYGFLPTATAAENVAALQDAVTGGGTILIDFPGTYSVNDTILLESNTTLIFGAGVFIQLEANKRFLLNAGALNRTYNENIAVIGLNLIANGHSVQQVIYGLLGYIAFFYIKNLFISHFSLLDGEATPFVIHICTFENAVVENVHIEGKKDAIHFGRGRNFVVRHGVFKTYDDPIALNTQDYPQSNPEFGDIVDGLIEDCYDMPDANGTTGYFSRILSGAWKDWTSGMEVQSYGDSVVSNGRVYVTAGIMGSTLTSTIQPTFASGTQTLSDGVTWQMHQDDATYSAVCKNIHFRDIHLLKDRTTAFSIHFDNSQYSRSYYPGASVPVHQNILLENIYIEAQITNLVAGVAPVDVLKIVNSDAKTVVFSYLSIPGLTYPITNVISCGNRFVGAGSMTLFSGNANRTTLVRMLGTIIPSGMTPSVSNVNLMYNDIGL